LLRDIQKIDEFNHFVLIENYTDFPSGMAQVCSAPNMALQEDQSYYGLMVNLGDAKGTLRTIALLKGSVRGRAAYEEVESDPIDPRINPLSDDDQRNHMPEIERMMGFLTTYLPECAKKVIIDKRHATW
jgi:hypothetical protein